MVIEINKELLVGLKEKNATEFNNIIDLILRNIRDSLQFEIMDSNFIYLNIETCEYLKNYINDKSFEEYNNNVIFIMSYVSEIKRYKIVISKTDDDNFKIQYEYELLKYLLVHCPTIITENINDKFVYELIFNNYSKYKLKQFYENGNGSQVSVTMEENCNNKRISVVITDHDTKYEGEQNRSSTPSKVQAKISELINLKKNNALYVKHVILNYKNIEGLIPYKYVIENLIDKDKVLFDKVYKIQKNKKWLNFFDFKKGIFKNLRNSNNNFIQDSLRWWSSQFNLESNFKEFIESKEDINDILTKGISKCKVEKLKDKDFLEKSSQEQKNEYKRLADIISPLIISNYYMVQ